MPRILLVDSHADVLKVFALVLETEGHEVWCARNGSEALSLASGCRPELVIIDIDLPLDEGRHLCREFVESENWNHPPVILTTARPGIEGMSLAWRLGAKMLLEKPLGRSDLLFNVDRAFA